MSTPAAVSPAQIAIPSVPEGAIAPECVRVKISSGASGVDLQAVQIQSATLRLYARGGSPTPLLWPLVIESVTPGLLVARHDFVTGDTEGKVGTYSAYVYMVPQAGGQYRAQCGLFQITSL